MPDTYQGWTNYATWGVSLVLNNDEGTYNAMSEHLAAITAGPVIHSNVTDGIWTADEATRFLMADFLKDFTEDLCGLEDEPGPSMMARQVLQAGLSEVNWDEIAESVIGAERESATA